MACFSCILLMCFVLLFWLFQAPVKSAAHSHKMDLLSFFKMLVPLAGQHELPSTGGQPLTYLLKTLSTTLGVPDNSGSGLAVRRGR
jgi:hypothetical protein